MEKSDRLKLKFFNAKDKDVLEGLEKFPSIIRDVVEEIWEKGRLGLSSEHVHIGCYHYNQYQFPYTGSVGKYEDVYSNHYLLGIPYAGRTIKWDLILKSSSGFIPDFVFDDDFQENPDTEVISVHLPSIVNWTIKDHSLVNVLKELMKLYKEFNIAKLQDDDLFNAKIEYDNLIEGKRFAPEDIEVLVRKDYVYILVPINFNPSELPRVGREEASETLDSFQNRHDDTAAVQFSFNNLTLKMDVTLCLSPRLEELLGNPKTFKMPAYSNVGGMNDYVSRLETLLDERCKTVLHNFKKRQEFISTILSQSGFGIIEYDEALFSMITLLYDFNGTYVILLINVPDDFPDEQPVVTLLSVYITSQSKPHKIVRDNYPYSPRWNSQEIFERMISFLENEIPKVKLC